MNVPKHRSADDLLALNRLAIALVLSLLFVAPPAAQKARGQDAPEPPRTAEPTAGPESLHLPPSAIATAEIGVDTILENELVRWLPLEIADAWSRENLGLDLDTVAEIRFVLGMPMGPGPPPVGFLVRLTAPFDPAGIDPMLLRREAPDRIGERRVYPMGDESFPLVLHALNPQTIFIASPMMLEPMITAKDEDGPLARLALANPAEAATIQVAVALEPIRPMINQVLPMLQRDLPPAFAPLGEIPLHLDSVLLECTLDGTELSSRLEMIAPNDPSARRLEAILKEWIDGAREVFLEQVDHQVRGDTKIDQAQLAYARRISRQTSDLLQPTRESDRVVYEVDSGVSVASVGVLTGLLLPAIQAAREAARRMNTSDQLKRIGLAMHNYHAAYNKLPGPAIVDEDGKPLLSWRVAILPFVEQQNLYEQFHLDEPWDSPHNLALLPRMPGVYFDRAVKTPPGETIFHALVDDKALQRFGGDNRFRDCLDGLSNTLMAVEADVSEAVPWTAPVDVEIDWDDPVGQMGHNRPGGFYVLLGDGSVRFMSHAVDVGLFKALITRAGREVIPEF